MKKVLIVSYHFPPLNNMAAKRFGVMCRYFKECGYETYVLTSKPGKNSYINSKLDLEVPLDEGHIVRVGRTGAAHYTRNIYVHTIIALLRQLHFSSRALDEESWGWSEEVQRKVSSRQWEGIDVVVGTYPFMGNLLAARYLAGKLHCPFIADIRDLISEYSETAAGIKRSYRLDTFMERCVLGKADGIVCVTPGFKKILKKKYPRKPIVTVLNGWEDKGERDKGKPAAEKKYLYYAGSLYEHRLESLALLIKCLKKVCESEEAELRIRSVGPRELDMKVRQLIAGEEMEDRVYLLEAATEDIIKKEQTGAAINVVLSSIHEEDRALMTTVPGKVYELLHEKAPVLAIAPEKSDVGKLLAYTQKGRAAVNEREIIDFISGENRKFQGNRRVLYFSRGRQAERFCKFLDRFVAERR